LRFSVSPLPRLHSAKSIGPTVNRLATSTNRWDCGIVNHSPYAVWPKGSEHGIPVAVIGIAGYLLLGVLAFFRRYGLMLILSVPALAFALYLAHVEEHVLGVWCLYCAISLGTISLMTLLLVITVIVRSLRRKPAPAMSA